MCAETAQAPDGHKTTQAEKWKQGEKWKLACKCSSRYNWAPLIPCVPVAKQPCPSGVCENLTPPSKPTKTLAHYSTNATKV
jgi:hypothetical protein